MASKTQLLPIKIWGQHGSNPPKISIIAKELSLPHEIVNIPFSDVKKPYYLAVNPNGRIPAIQDPNFPGEGGLTLWESGAIIEYLIEKYDASRKLSFEPGSKDAYLAKQWLFYQVSGQGPYYGQAAWFHKFHPEKLPSAYERYVKEMHRVTGVLEGRLKEVAEAGGNEDGPWIVGNKFSFVDIAWFSWQVIIQLVVPKEDYDIGDYPLVKDWIERLNKRKSVNEVMEATFRAFQES